jgi:S1-C subfamily serine protease
MHRVIGFLGVLIAVLAVQACALAPQPDPTPPGAAVRKHVLRRVSAIIVTDRSDLDSWVKRGFPVSQAPGDADGGSATPVAPDGYFLTADHVLERMEGRGIHVIYGGGGPLTPHLARVVWRSKRADLALLRIDAKTPLHYEFTHPRKWLPVGTPVVHGGIATGFNSDPGKLGTSLPPANRFTGTRKFKIDIPLQPGDSGGPVVDAHGGLVGINSAVEFLVPMETAYFVDSEASRPNPAMIRSLIENDRARNSRTSGNVE